MRKMLRAACLAVALAGGASAAFADSFLDNGIESDGPLTDPSVKNIPNLPPGSESAGVAVASPVLNQHPRAIAGQADCPPDSPCAVASPARDTPTPLYPITNTAKTERLAGRKRS